MLREILQRLGERGPMTPGELALALRADGSALEGMLRTLERQGRVERAAPERCAGCAGCAAAGSGGPVYRLRPRTGKPGPPP